jgi:hypothetical protein
MMSFTQQQKKTLASFIHKLSTLTCGTLVILSGSAAFFTVSALLSNLPANAFCVYNGTDKEIYFSEHTPKGMIKTIDAGKNSCCNWKNKDCNPSKQRDKMLDVYQIRVELTKPKWGGGFARSYTCGLGTAKVLGEQVYNPQAKSQIQAGGYWTVDANPGFVSTKKVDNENPPYIVKSWSYDNKVLNTYPCPAKYQFANPA